MSYTCVWEYGSDGYFGTECGGAFEFAEGDVFANSFRFCPYCGNEIVVKEASHDL